MTNLTDADLAAMKARADAAQQDYAKTYRQNRGWMTSTERNADQCSKDALTLLVENAALRKQIDLAEKSLSDNHVTRETLNLGYYRTQVNCWCGDSWWFGIHDGDPHHDEAEDAHLAEYDAEEFNAISRDGAVWLRARAAEKREEAK